MSSMFAARPARLLSLAVAVTTLAGCSTMAPGLYVPAGSKTHAAATVKAPTVQIIDAKTKPTVTADAATVSIEVGFDTTTRQLMAADDVAVATTPVAQPIVPAELDRVEFTVTFGKSTLKSTVTRAQFLSGKAVLQLNNLPAGPLHVEAAAIKADGTNLVTASGDGTIAVGQLTVVKLKCRTDANPGGGGDTPGVGHVRLEMDCWSDGSCTPKPPAPQPTPTAFVPVPVLDIQFASSGDPHEEGANKLKFENQKIGTFLALQTLTKDFSIIKHQDEDPLGRWPGTTLNQAVGFKSGNDTFAYYVFNHRFRLNGKTTPIAPGAVVKAPGGMTITRVSSTKDATLFRIVTPQGDTVNLTDMGAYLNLAGTLGKDRVVHEVSGEFGTFNNGTPEMAMLNRDGSAAKDLASFLQNWIAKADEDFFGTVEPMEIEKDKELPLAPTAATN